MNVRKENQRNVNYQSNGMTIANPLSRPFNPKSLSNSTSPTNTANEQSNQQILIAQYEAQISAEANKSRAHSHEQVVSAFGGNHQTGSKI